MLNKIQKIARDAFVILFSFTPKKISFLLCFVFTSAFLLQYVAEIMPNIRRLAVFSQLEWLKNLDYDGHLFYKKKTTPSPRVAVIEINERSLKALGRFPFSRSVYAKLIQNLENAGAAAVGFDIVFSEAEQERALQLIQPLITIAPANSVIHESLRKSILEIDGDGFLLSAVSTVKLPVVYGFASQGLSHALVDTKKDSSHSLSINQLKFLSRFGFVKKRNLKETEPEYFSRLLEPLILPTERLSIGSMPNSNVRLGSFDAQIDNDGIIRAAPLAVKHEAGLYASLSLSTLSAALKEAPSLWKEKDGYNIGFENNRISMPVNDFGMANINFYGSGRNIPFYELIDVLENRDGKFGANLFKDKIIYVGVTAIGLKDLRNTPVNPDYPGVEIHATITSNILQRDFLLKTADYYIWGFLLTSIFAFCLSVLQFRLHPGVGFLLTFAVVALIQIFAQKVFYDNGLIVPSLLPSIQCICIFAAALVYRYLTTAKEKKYVRAAFARYVSGAVVDEMLKDQSKLKLGGQKKRLTVLFTDMVGFTKLSETLDAQKLSSLLNEFFTEMTQVILDNNGTLDKYMGDAIMCFWGAPLEQEKHASLACKAALQMQDVLLRINERWEKNHGFRVQMRIGINTGEMSVGNMGSDQIFSYTVLGDNVNLGSRLEGVNNIYGTWIIVSESTKAEVEKLFFFRELDVVSVKGKENPVAIFELLGALPVRQSVIDWCNTYERGRKLFLEQKWNEAKEVFQLCVKMNESDKASILFLERIADLETKTLPTDWDGVWKLTSK